MTWADLCSKQVWLVVPFRSCCSAEACRCWAFCTTRTSLFTPCRRGCGQVQPGGDAAGGAQGADGPGGPWRRSRCFNGWGGNACCLCLAPSGRCACFCFTINFPNHHRNSTPAPCPLQERERRGESWQPRWFKPLPADAEIIQVSTEELANILLPFGQAGWFHFLSERRWSGRSHSVWCGIQFERASTCPTTSLSVLSCHLQGEYSNEECPQFEFTGEYLQQEARPASASEGTLQQQEAQAGLCTRGGPFIYRTGLAATAPGPGSCCGAPMPPSRLFRRGTAAHSASLAHPHPSCVAAEVQGAGFSPWCYPDIHPQLGKESQRP